MQKFKRVFAELSRVLHFFHVFHAKLAGNSLGSVLFESLAIVFAVWIAAEISDFIANLFV